MPPHATPKFNRLERFLGFPDTSSASFWRLAVILTLPKVLIAATVSVAPQEAYYWNYAQHLDWSYFDHPPLAAWTILATTSVLGDNAFSVHLAALLWSVATLWGLYRLGNLLGGAKAGIIAAFIWGLSPAGLVGGIFITPDAPLLACYLAAALIFGGMVGAAKPPVWSWLALGVAIGLATLAKYTGLFAGLGVILYALLSANGRKWWRGVGPWLALLSFFLVITPILLWNANHDWESFLFQSSRRTGELGRFSFGLIGSFLLSQAYTIGPLTLIALFAGIGRYSVLRPVVNTGGQAELVRALLGWAAPAVAIFVSLSGFYWIKINWPLTAYIVLAPLAGLWLTENWPHRRGWVVWIGASSSLLTVATIALMYFPAQATVAPGNTVVGWGELAERVWQKRLAMSVSQPAPAFLGLEYKAASELAFHLRDSLSPGEEILSDEIIGQRGLQYDFWTDPSEYNDRNMIGVRDLRTMRYAPLYENFFDSVGQTDSLEIERGGAVITVFYITDLYGYHPPQSAPRRSP